MRVLLLHNIVNPHMTPVFEELARIDGIELEVAYFAEREADRSWSTPGSDSFRSRILPGRQINLSLRWDTLSFHFNPGLVRYLREGGWQAVINSGWMSLSNWAAFLHCRMRSVPHVLWAGSTAGEPSLQRTLTRPLVRSLVAHSDGWVSYGSASTDYLVSLGADPARVVPAYHCVDNARFLARCEATREAVPALRKRWGLEGKRVVLFVGRLLERKGVDDLIAACGRVAASVPELALVVIGDGPMRADYERLAQRTPAVPVVFTGHVDLEDLPAWYQAADVFVLPSLEEVWGLVVNEAALAGLPVVVSRTCGAAWDLVEPEVNGFRVDPGDAEALAAAIGSVLRDPARARAMGAASRRIVEKCSPTKVARSLAQAAQAAALRRSVA